MEKQQRFIYKKHGRDATDITIPTEDRESFMIGSEITDGSRSYKYRREQNGPILDLPPLDFGCCCAEPSQCTIQVRPDELDLLKPYFQPQPPQDEIIRVTLVNPPLSYINYNPYTIERVPIEPKRARKHIPIGKLLVLSRQKNITKLKPNTKRSNVLLQTQYAKKGVQNSEFEAAVDNMKSTLTTEASSNIQPLLTSPPNMPPEILEQPSQQSLRSIIEPILMMSSRSSNSGPDYKNEH